MDQKKAKRIDENWASLKRGCYQDSKGGGKPPFPDLFYVQRADSISGFSSPHLKS